MRIGNVQNGHISTADPKFIKLPRDGSLKRFDLSEGDILVSLTGNVGRVGVIQEEHLPAALNQRVARISIRKESPATRELLLFFLCSDWFREELSKAGRGAAQQNVSTKDLVEIKIPIPPQEEQRRIIQKLDEAFAGLAKAKENAEKNLQNARALFESHLEFVFTQRGPEWAEKPFEDLIESNVIGLTKNSREQGDDKPWPYVKMNNITQDNRFEFTSFTCVDANSEELSKFSLKNGDFLFNTRNSHELVGKSCIYESVTSKTVLYNNNIMRIRFRREIDPRYILHAFSSSGVSKRLNKLKSGTTNVSAIYFKDLKSLLIPYPPIEEQKNISRKLMIFSEETQRLARLYEQKLEALESFKKSILHEAFSGNL